MDCDQEIFGLIGCFRNRLRRLIMVEPLMDLLNFLEDDDKELVRVKLNTQGNLRAVDQLLDTITKGAHPQGWFKEFTDALETVGCTHAVKYITNSPPSPLSEAENDSCIKLINLLQLSLVKMKTRDVCISCYSFDILTEEDRDNILAEIDNRGNISGARLLLRRVVRNDAGWFSTFLRALRKTGHHDLVRELLGQDFFDIDEDLDLYTDPCEQGEQASGTEGKSSCTSEEANLCTDPCEQGEQASANEDKGPCASDASIKDQVPAQECPSVDGKVMPQTDGTVKPSTALPYCVQSANRTVPLATFPGPVAFDDLQEDAYDSYAFDDYDIGDDAYEPRAFDDYDVGDDAYEPRAFDDYDVGYDADSQGCWNDNADYDFD